MDSSDSVYSDDFLPRSDGEDSPSSPQPLTKKKRTRMNLSGLSLDEKIKRRKMKNRAAAQAARDRKKCRMEEMEATIAKLSEEKLKLVRENALLKAENDKLKAERLAFPSGSSTLSTKVQSSSEGEAVVVDPFDSAAVINDSQQQKQGSRLHANLDLEMDQEDKKPSPTSMMPFVLWFMTLLNLTTSSTGLKNVPNTWSKLLLQQLTSMEQDSKPSSEMLEKLLSLYQVYQSLPPSKRDLLFHNESWRRLGT